MRSPRKPFFIDGSLPGPGNLSQANRLSRTYAVMLDALNRHRGAYIMRLSPADAAELTKLDATRACSLRNSGGVP